MRGDRNITMEQIIGLPCHLPSRADGCGGGMMKNKGIHQYRFKSNLLEKVFAETWEAQNGRGHTLEYLLSLRNERESVTDREREVAATVIQWLGSPVGQSFLEDVEDTLQTKMLT